MSEKVKLTDKEKADYLEMAAYMLALTAARDTDATQSLDKTVLARIRDLLADRLRITGANPNMLIMQTVGVSEEEGLMAVEQWKEEGYVS